MPARGNNVDSPTGSVLTRLEGRCFVTHLRAGPPVRQGTLSCWPLVGRRTGALHISLCTYEFAPGVAPVLAVRDWDEVWYVLEGHGHIDLHGRTHAVGAATGIHIRPGSRVLVRNPGPECMLVVASRCPDPDTELDLDGGEGGRGSRSAGASGRGGVQTASERGGRTAAAPDSHPLVHLSEVEPEATGERWFRVLVDARLGCEPVTQFVGSIPPGRAPDHAHDYEEVLCILEGSGVMWAGSQSAPIAAGSCIYLPRGQTHCVENRGGGALELLGVFYPAGSPAARMDMQARRPSSPKQGTSKEEE